MLTLYTWTTPNGRKASIMLEEIGARYAVTPVNIGKDEQFDPDFLAISPNNKIPAIVDAPEDGAKRTVFETGAILIYLAEKSGQLLPPDGPARDKTLEWLFWATSGLAPMLGQWNYFARRAEEKTPTAVDRFTKECVRLFHVLEKRLAETPFLASAYSIADIGAFTWADAVLPKLRGDAAKQLGDTPSIDRWLTAINARPAVMRGLKIPEV
jgi:GST-like protein